MPAWVPSSTQPTSASSDVSPNASRTSALPCIGTDFQAEATPSACAARQMFCAAAAAEASCSATGTFEPTWEATTAMSAGERVALPAVLRMTGSGNPPTVSAARLIAAARVARASPRTTTKRQGRSIL